MDKSTVQQAAMEAAKWYALKRFAGDPDRDQKVADAVSVAWELSLDGSETASPSTYARFSVRRVTTGRQFTQSVRSIDGPPTPRAEKPERTSLDVAALVSPGPDPAEIVQIRHDTAAWWSGLTGRKRQIAEALALEYTTSEVAEMFGCSPARVSQVRRELAESWASL
jgi:hypothetical protein